MRRILFCKINEPFGCFSNFSPHPVQIHGLEWRTTEHYFQASKFLGSDNDHALAIRAATSPLIAARMGRSRAHPIRADWETTKDDVMRRAVRAKVAQHADVRETLAGTGDAEIVEHTPRDAYWGDGGDGSGRNMLGRILMEVRAELLDPECARKSEPDAPLLGPRATIHPDHYTPDNICRAMGFTPFHPTPGGAGTVARILLRPSFSPEVCLTIETGTGADARAIVHALEHQFHSRQFPTFPDSCGVEAMPIDAELAERAIDCLTDGHEPRSNLEELDGVQVTVVGIDGMSYDSAVRAPSGLVTRSVHLGRDPVVEEILRELVPVLATGARDPRVSTGLAGISGHLDPPID